MGILEHGGTVRTATVEERSKATLQGTIHEHVEAGSAVFTDAPWRMLDSIRLSPINY